MGSKLREEKVIYAHNKEWRTALPNFDKDKLTSDNRDQVVISTARSYDLNARHDSTILSVKNQFIECTELSSKSTVPDLKPNIKILKYGVATVTVWIAGCGAPQGMAKWFNNRKCNYG